MTPLELAEAFLARAVFPPVGLSYVYAVWLNETRAIGPLALDASVTTGAGTPGRTDYLRLAFFPDFSPRTVAELDRAALNSAPAQT